MFVDKHLMTGPKETVSFVSPRNSHFLLYLPTQN